MMHGHEKSDLAIVAVKPANKIGQFAIARPSCGLINHDVVAAVGGGARRNEDRAVSR